MRILGIFLIVVLNGGYHECHGANILLLQELLSPSHFLCDTYTLTSTKQKTKLAEPSNFRFKKVTDGLLTAGHNVTVVTPGIFESSEKLHYIYMDQVYNAVYKSSESNVDFFAMSEVNPFLQFPFFSSWILQTCKGLVASKGWETLKNYPNDFKFDLIIHDFPAGICLLSFIRKFNNPPLILMTASSDYNMIAYFTRTALTPSLSSHMIYRQELKPTFFGRVENYLLNLVDYFYFYYYVFPESDKIVAKSFQNLPPLTELARPIVTIFNYDAAVDGVRQLPPNVIGAGGLQIETPKNLTGELKALVNEANKGVILFSLGTNVKSELLGDERILHILKAFSNFPLYTFLWKLDTDNLPIELPKNVFIRKWIPQNDILAHEKTKLFITHAGLLSTQEAIWYGIPMLNIPIFIDQFGNSYRSVKKGVAEELLIKDLSSSTLTEKIQLLLSEEKYKKNMAVASRAFRDQKDTPLERALWWIEWTMRNPDSVHFKSSDLSFLSVQSIDVIAFLTLTSVVILFLLFSALKKLCKMLLYLGWRDELKIKHD